MYCSNISKIVEHIDTARKTTQNEYRMGGKLQKFIAKRRSFLQKLRGDLRNIPWSAFSIVAGTHYVQQSRVCQSL
jgi:hypothetical protein